MAGARAPLRRTRARTRTRRLVSAVRRRGMRSQRPELSRRLLDQKVAATPMTDAWGPAVATRYVRLVFSNEPVQRLALLGERLRAALP